MILVTLNKSHQHETLLYLLVVGEMTNLLKIESKRLENKLKKKP